MAETTELITESSFRSRLRGVVECALFRHTILGLIAINAVILGLQTSPRAMAAIGPELILIDHVILWILLLRLFFASLSTV